MASGPASSWEGDFHWSGARTRMTVLVYFLPVR
jgi:hypothetical protein